MGVRSWRSLFVLLWWVYFFVIGSVSADTICDVPGCNCTTKAAPWKTVNCTLKNVQEVRLESQHIPDEVIEIFVVGGGRIILGPKAFNRMRGLTLLYFRDTKHLVVEKEAFRDLTAPSLIIQIQNCDQVNIKTGAFENVQSSLEVEIIRCASVSVEKSAFSKLQIARFKEVSKLLLAEGTFEFKNQGSIGRHGPVTTIYFDNVTISSLPRQTFFSTLAEIEFRNSYLHEIQNEAFLANQINSISFIRTRIDNFRSGAFNGRTLIFNFKISHCTIKSLETGAVMGGVSNLTVENSSITDIHRGAINITVAEADIAGNEIINFNSFGFVFHSWNKILFEQNIVKFLDSSFLVARDPQDVVEFSYVGNDVIHAEPGALSFVPELEDRVFRFKDNFFNQTCHCAINEWMVDLTSANITTKYKQMMNNTFCTINAFLSQCFELPVGIINLHNFTELVCNDTVVCEPYKGETKIVNTTSKIFAENGPTTTTNWLTLIITLTSLLLLLVMATFVVMLVRGSRWLKRKGYFRKIQYNNQNEHSNDEENTIETVDESDKLDISEDLTMELLQDLSKKLDDPNTHQEASEMIEQLYQKYIRNNGTDNNNHQQDEEAHLYEELGNLQLNNAIGQDPNKQQDGPRSILRLMEEKFNTQFEDIDADDRRPALVGEYSEPSDAAVHLYSELKQNKDTESDNKDSLKSRGSSTMAFRPLPDKPGSSKM